MAFLPPSPTLYVSNLSTRLRREDLRRHLYAYFSAHGQVLDVVALAAWKMRGQAFVVFKDTPSATNALRQCQGFVFFDKPMVSVWGRWYCVDGVDVDGIV